MPVGEVFLGAFLQVLFDRLAPSKLSLFPCEDGIRSELKQWKRKFSMIKAVLNDAEEKQLKNEAVKMWLEDLQDLAYDVEDILDEYATQVLERKLMTEQPTNRIADYFSSWTPSALISQTDMKSKTEEITCRLEDLCEEKNYLGLKEIAGGSSTVAWQRPPSTCVPNEPAVIGRDADKAKILEMVLSDKQSGGNFHVIPIVGIGGVGKTTLAREVYNDKAVGDFNPRAWACVSDDFDVLRISEAILESITASTCTLTNLNEVQVQLKNNIAGKKFLLVLDDVWSKDYVLWEALKSPFLAGAPGSIIIATTRNKDVALTMELEVCYNLELLPEDVCWAIFEKHISRSRVITARKNMELIREKVVKKCKGLPLAARTFSVFDKIIKLGHHPSHFTYGSLLKGLCKGGNLQEAKQFLNKLHYIPSAVDTIAYNTVISEACKSEKLWEADTTREVRVYNKKRGKRHQGINCDKGNN